MPLVEAVLVGLAAWRLTAMLSYENGPGRIFRSLRSSLGIKHNDAGEPTLWPSGLVTDLITCPWCLGGYAAAATWTLWEYVSEAVVIVLAAWAILVAVERWNHHA